MVYVRETKGTGAEAPAEPPPRPKPDIWTPPGAGQP
jgi:hypothetical protein